VPPILVGVSAAEEFVHRLSMELVETLGGDLLSLGLYGSYATGDFAVGRSDVDLLAVVAEDPEPATFDRLFEMHSRLDRDLPEWSGHVEVEYVAAEAVQDVVDGADTRHPMVRISPGEPLHRLDATRHYLLNWAAAIEANRPVARAAPAELLPAIDWELVRQVILDHVRAWPQWVLGMMMTPGGQAYSVLTLCRSAASLATGHQVSKRQGAGAGRTLFPEWSGLIAWACSWWYEGGTDSDPGKRDEVERFVNDVSRRLLLEHDQ
jgi:predicted nucleotidyltransferase